MVQWFKHFELFNFLNKEALAWANASCLSGFGFFDSDCQVIF